MQVATLSPFLVMLGCSGFGICENPGDSSCFSDQPEFLGDPSANMELQPWSFCNLPHEFIGTLPITEGGPVRLFAPTPTQYILATGVHANNIALGDATITSWLTVPGQSETFGWDSRVTSMAPLNGDATAGPPDLISLDYYANLALCPLANLPMNLFEEVWTLHIQVEDAAGRTSQVATDVVPICPFGDLACLNACSAE